MGARPAWGLLLAALACQGRNPAYLVSVTDGPGSVGRDGPVDVASNDHGPQLDAAPADTALPADAALPAETALPSDTTLPPGTTPDVVIADVAPPDPPRDASPPDVAVLPLDAPVPKGSGLMGSYFDGTQLENGTGTGRELQRDDRTIDFDWPTGTRPAPAMDHDNFSIRWLGDIMPHATGTFTFTTVTDDGVRLWVNNVLILQNWTASGGTTNNGSITLTAYMKYPIKMEYRESTGAARARLYWTPPGQATMQIVPADNLFPAPQGP